MLSSLQAGWNHHLSWFCHLTSLRMCLEWSLAVLCSHHGWFFVYSNRVWWACRASGVDISVHMDLSVFSMVMRLAGMLELMARKIPLPVVSVNLSFLNTVTGEAEKILTIWCLVSAMFLLLSPCLVWWSHWCGLWNNGPFFPTIDCALMFRKRSALCWKRFGHSKLRR